MPTQPSNLSSANLTDEAIIRQAIAEWSKNLVALDLDKLLAGYHHDIVLYDVKPPYKIVGIDAYRKNWEECLPFFPERFKSEHRDLVIHVEGDLATIHGLHHMVPLDEKDKDHPAFRSWVRVTAILKKINGQWLCVHEHVSIPFDCTTGLVSAITDI